MIWRNLWPQKVAMGTREDAKPHSSLRWAMLSHSVMSDSLQPMDYSPLGSYVHGDFPGKNAGVGCHVLLQGIFPTQGLNPGLSHCRQILYQPSYPGSPKDIINCIQKDFKNFVVIQWLGLGAFTFRAQVWSLAQPKKSPKKQTKKNFINSMIG